MRVRVRVSMIAAALALVLAAVAVPPASAASATYSGGGCNAKFTASQTFAKTERTSGKCKRISVELYLYVNGSPGIYVWGGEGSTTGKAVSRTRPSGYTVSLSYHTVLNRRNDMVLAV